MNKAKESLIYATGALALLVFVMSLVLFALGRPAALKMMPPLDFFFLLPAILVILTKKRSSLPSKAAYLAFAAVGIFTQRLILFVLPMNTYSLILSVLLGAAVAFILVQSYRMKPMDKKREGQMEDPPGPFPLVFDEAGTRYINTAACDFHTHIIGGTGSGKTYRVVKPFIYQDIAKNRIGTFIYDVKSNLHSEIAFYAKDAGRTRDLKYFDIGHPERSMTYNPLYGDDPAAVANRVFTALYYESDSNSRYYYELASAFINNLVALLMKEYSTITLLDLFKATAEIDTLRTISSLCQKYPETTQAQYFKGNWLNKNTKQRQEELSGLINKLQRFCTREWAPLINTTKPDITMQETVNNGQILLFGVAAARYTDDAKPLAIMAIMDLFAQAAPRFEMKPEKPFRIYLDEFYDIAYPGFVKMVNKCREAKMDWILAHQSLGDLSSVSKDFLNQISTNTRNKVILALDDPDTAEYLARLMGTEKDDVKVYSYDTREATILGGAKAAGYTVPVQDKFRFHPNEIKEMPKGMALVRVIEEKGPAVFKTEIFPAPAPPAGFNSQDVLGIRNNQKKECETNIQSKDVMPIARPVEDDKKSALESFGEKIGSADKPRGRVRRKV